MKTQQIAAGVAMFGLVFVVTGMIWPTVDDAQRQWTEADAHKYQETVSRAHVGSHLQLQAESRRRMHGGEPIDPERLLQHREDLKTLKELKTRLENARQRPLRIASLLKWSGSSLVAVGAALFFAVRSKEA